jgi:hypothetical protein
MRHIALAALLFSPVLLSAAAPASKPTTDTTVASKGRVVSTGVIAPKIADPADLYIVADAFDHLATAKDEISVTVHVDEKGRVSNFRFPKSGHSDLDFRVVEALSRSRFIPASLDNQPIPIDVNLTVAVKH